MGATGDLLNCHHSVCFLHFHHCLVRFCHQTRQAQTAKDSSVSGKDNWDLLEQAHGQVTSTQTAHTQDMNSLNSFSLVSSTEHCAAK